MFFHKHQWICNMLPLGGNARLTITLLCVLSTVSRSNSQVAQKTRPEVEHRSDLIKELPADGLLRQQLLSGARGDGVRIHGWMTCARKVSSGQSCGYISISIGG